MNLIATGCPEQVFKVLCSHLSAGQDFDLPRGSIAHPCDRLCTCTGCGFSPTCEDSSETKFDYCRQGIAKQGCSIERAMEHRRQLTALVE